MVSVGSGICEGAAGGRVDFDGIAPIADGLWHHICVVHDRDGEATFWQDGAFMGARFIGGQGNLDNALGELAVGEDATLN